MSEKDMQAFGLHRRPEQLCDCKLEYLLGVKPTESANGPPIIYPEVLDT